MNYEDYEKWLKDNRCECAREIESLSDLRDYETLPRFMNYAFKASCLKCHGKGWPNEKEPEKKPEKCENCKYFEKNDADCHRYPPIFMYGLLAQIEGIAEEMISHLSEGVWPAISDKENDWCGEFKASDGS